MRIETYSEKYAEDVINLVKNFHAEAVIEYDDMFDSSSIINSIKHFGSVDPSSAFLLIINDKCEGILFGQKFKSLINDKMIFQELIWYVNKPYRTHGINLLRQVEKSLKESGVSIMIMAVLENSKTEKLKKFYERLGYKHMETHYTRNL